MFDAPILKFTWKCLEETNFYPSLNYEMMMRWEMVRQIIDLINHLMIYHLIKISVSQSTISSTIYYHLFSSHFWGLLYLSNHHINWDRHDSYSDNDKRDDGKLWEGWDELFYHQPSTIIPEAVPPRRDEMSWDERWLGDDDVTFGYNKFENNSIWMRQMTW